MVGNGGGRDLTTGVGTGVIGDFFAVGQNALTKRDVLVVKLAHKPPLIQL